MVEKNQIQGILTKHGLQKKNPSDKSVVMTQMDFVFESFIFDKKYCIKTTLNYLLDK